MSFDSFRMPRKAVDTAQPSAEPSSQPSTEPESQPSAEPESQPTSEPTSEPESQPTSEPTSEPESQPTDEPISEGQAEFSFAEAVEIPTHLFMDAVDLDGDNYVDIILKETTVDIPGQKVMDKEDSHHKESLGW